ncbi:hypothetical protein D9619_011143 [Psilocybe cf. subviscida]|uniref:BTB domain-containing protein n=1 Tax=Psilocybe cf. subviscida TaxID=2480587 RepID=A0A8H5F5B8_9AGAR|nr:hypothetical protein D9619_011143 [Psilocybe cf. subviscida]
MSTDVKSHLNYTDEDVVKWVISQAEGTTGPRSSLPVWMTSAFEDGIKRKKEIEATVTAAQGMDSDTDGDKQDDVFNFELLYFKVEKTIFTVIKDWLMVEGSAFQDMFALPVGDNTPAQVEGTMRTNPIILEQTNAASFKAFLSLLYGSRGKPLETYDDWVGALELAMRWNFEQVRKQAIVGVNAILPSLGPAARIILARRFSVGPWLRTGLIDLVTQVAEKELTRTELINGKEFALDITTIANVFYACFEVNGNDQDYEPGSDTENDFCWSCTTLINNGCLIPSGCPSCKAVGDLVKRRRQLIRDIQLVVDSIFGAEIGGCVYQEEL